MGTSHPGRAFLYLSVDVGEQLTDGMTVAIKDREDMEHLPATIVTMQVKEADFLDLAGRV